MLVQEALVRIQDQHVMLEEVLIQRSQMQT